VFYRGLGLWASYIASESAFALASNDYVEAHRFFIQLAKLPEKLGLAPARRGEPRGLGLNGAGLLPAPGVRLPSKIRAILADDPHALLGRSNRQPYLATVVRT